MDPFTIMAVAGLGMKLASAYGVFGDNKKESAVAQQQAQLEMQIEAQKKQQMELMGRRQQMEVLRNSQRARSLAQNRATNQGAQFGSGLQGGYGQIAGDTGTNLLGINQNLEIGRNLSGLNSQISSGKMEMASLQGDEAMWKGIGSMGGDLISMYKPGQQLFGSGEMGKFMPSFGMPGGKGWGG